MSLKRTILEVWYLLPKKNYSDFSIGKEQKMEWRNKRTNFFIEKNGQFSMNLIDYSNFVLLEVHWGFQNITI